jgi:hypothetical protein
MSSSQTTAIASGVSVVPLRCARTGSLNHPLPLPSLPAVCELVTERVLTVDTLVRSWAKLLPSAAALRHVCAVGRSSALVCRNRSDPSTWHGYRQASRPYCIVLTFPSALRKQHRTFDAFQRAIRRNLYRHLKSHQQRS